MRNNKGITLVALIITIIVMVILAGVAIVMTTGNSGVLNKAELASKRQTYAIAEEKIRAQSVYVEEGENVGKIDLSLTEDNISRLNLSEIKNIIPSENLLRIVWDDDSEIEISGVNGRSLEDFKWSDVYLDVECGIDYRFYDSYTHTVFVINFTEDGKVIIKENSVIKDTYDATDIQNRDENGNLEIVYNYNQTAYNTVITMNNNNIDIDANLKGFTTVTYIKNYSPDGNKVYGTENDFFILTKDNKILYYQNEEKILEGSIVRISSITEIDEFKEYQIIDNGKSYELYKFEGEIADNKIVMPIAFSKDLTEYYKNTITAKTVSIAGTSGNEIYYINNSIDPSKYIK